MANHCFHCSLYRPHNLDFSTVALRLRILQKFYENQSSDLRFAVNGQPQLIKPRSIL